MPSPGQSNPDCGSDRQPAQASLRGLDWSNFFLADVQTGVGPFLAIYLTAMPNLGWNQESAGWALTVCGIAGIMTQAPIGALIDCTRSKRLLIAIAVLCLAGGAAVIAVFPRVWPVMAAQTLIGATSSVFIPTIAAISLGLVGHRNFDARQGRNQMFNSAGNVVAALAMGLLGYLVSNRSIFGFVIAMVIPTLLCLRLIDPEEIDHDLARGCDAADDSRKPSSGSIRALAGDKRLLIFLACAVMFHFANAAMLPLLGEVLGQDKGRSSMLFMTACVVTTQAVIAVLARPIGRYASTRGRKRVLLAGFAVLPIRGVIYTLTRNSFVLVGTQILDGIGAAVFGVVSVLVIADLTRGTGRFNLAQGAIAMAVGIGASLSQAFAGNIAHHQGFNTAFLYLAAIAACAFAAFLLFMPETLTRDRSQDAS